MTRTSSRYLIFYAIIGVGLAFSWGQVGKRAQIRPDARMTVMTLEEDCKPYSRPCAAYAQEYGLVLGPHQGGGLRLQATRPMPVTAFEISQFEGNGVEVEKPAFAKLSADSWRVEPLARVGRLRVSVLLEDRQWIAEFPLQ